MSFILGFSRRDRNETLQGRCPHDCRRRSPGMYFSLFLLKIDFHFHLVFIIYLQVVLQDVEILHHASTMAVKRHSDGRPIKDVLARVVDIEKRCGTGIEGHRSKKHCPWIASNRATFTWQRSDHLLNPWFHIKLMPRKFLFLFLKARSNAFSHFRIISFN